jgi:hypothetical protein
MERSKLPVSVPNDRFVEGTDNLATQVHLAQRILQLISADMQIIIRRRPVKLSKTNK